VADRHAAVTGEDAATRLANAKRAAVSAITPHLKRLSERTVEKSIREGILSQLPGQPEIAAAIPINISIDGSAAVAAELGRLQDLINNGNLSEAIERYPVRETPALAEIARKLGFQSQEQYEGTVLKLLMDDQETLQLVRSFFDTLLNDMP